VGCAPTQKGLAKVPLEAVQNFLERRKKTGGAPAPGLIFVRLRSGGQPTVTGGGALTLAYQRRREVPSAPNAG